MTLSSIGAITFDFGNTLVPVSRAALEKVVSITADAICARWPDLERAALLQAWAEERDRQFREEVPQFREVDLAERLTRVFARLRGMPPPAADEPWDQAEAERRSDPDDVTWAVEAYSRAFVDGLPAPPGVGELLGRLARGRDLAILSNWPLAATIDRYAEAHGWAPSLRAIVVSQRVGTIKPHPAIFEAARAALGGPSPATILHVGDDWAADIVGAAAAGWRTAWLPGLTDDSPLPSSERAGPLEPDLILASLDELESNLAPVPADGRHNCEAAAAIGHSPHWRRPAPVSACTARLSGRGPTLPGARRTRSPMGRGPTTSAAHDTRPPESTAPLVVLVVDGAPEIRAHVARALTLAGIEVAVAADGRAALRLVADDRVRPAVVVTEIEMAGMTGIELAARLLALRPSLRIVMMTADRERAAAARGHPSLVDAVLMKPVRPAELIRAVRPASGPEPR